MGTMLTPKLVQEHEQHLPAYFPNEMPRDLQDPVLGKVWPLPVRVFYREDIAFKPNGGDAPKFRGFFVLPGRDGRYGADEAVEDYVEYTDGLKRMRSTAPDPHAQWKYTHAIRILSSLKIPVILGPRHSQLPPGFNATAAFQDPE